MQAATNLTEANEASEPSNSTLSHVTDEMLDGAIKEIHMVRIDKTGTVVCALVLVTGFVVVGSAFTADASRYEEFEKDIQQGAYHDALTKLKRYEFYRVMANAIGG